MPQRERSMKKYLDFINSNIASRSILILIVINTVTIGLETNTWFNDHWGHYLKVLDEIILGIFCVEMIWKLVVRRFLFFRNAWDIFDLSMVILSLASTIPELSICRVFRVFRVLRVISSIPELKIIVQSLLLSLTKIGWISILLALVFYIFAVIGTKVFGNLHPQWFGSFSESVFTLFQVMTMEGWAMEIARPIMDTHPYASIFFVFFILISAFIFLNIVVAVLTNTMSEVSEEHGLDFHDQLLEKKHNETIKKIENLEKKLEQLEKLITKSNSKHY